MIAYTHIAQIKAISFDLDDTLYDNMPFIYAAEEALNDFIKAKYPQLAVLTKPQWQFIRYDVLKRRPSLKNDISTFRKEVLSDGFKAVNFDNAKIAGAVDKCYSFFYEKRSDFKVSESVITVLKKLSSHFPLAAITNGNVNCATIGIEPFFDVIIHASTDYPMKPSPPIFFKAARDLGLSPQQILHVGDDLHKDIYGARMAGFQTAWLAVNRSMHLREERVSLLPHLQLTDLSDLLLFCE